MRRSLPSRVPARPRVGLAGLLLTVALLPACDSIEFGSGSAGAAAYLLVGDRGALNESERGVVSAVEAIVRPLVVLDDDGFRASDVDDCRLVVVSKTVRSDAVGVRLRGVACGIVFWEDNLQMLAQLATIFNDGSGGTAWHGTDDDLFVRPDAPAELRAGLSGERDFYVRRDEITWAPRTDLTDSATVVAELDEPGGHPAIYVVERGARLSDGSAAAGRRAFFGLYDDTFRLLTPDGRALFDAIVQWAMR